MHRILLLITLFSVFISRVGISQFHPVEQTTIFQSRVDNPIEVEVFEKDGKILFSAKNRSFYPYQLSLYFKEMQNLHPMIPQKDFIVHPGYTKLVTFNVLDETLGHSYNYEVSYKMGDPKNKVILDYPYLVPIKGVIDLDGVKYENSFICKVMDTVFCTRKGMVTATPNMYHQSDRISKSKSLEVRHADGTVMVYLNTAPNEVFTEVGKYVYPGQPLALIASTKTQIILYQSLKDSGFKSLPIKYFIQNEDPVNFSNNLQGRMSIHPSELILKELTKREQKKLRKNQLY